MLILFEGCRSSCEIPGHERRSKWRSGFYQNLSAASVIQFIFFKIPFSSYYIFFILCMNLPLKHFHLKPTQLTILSPKNYQTTQKHQLLKIVLQCNSSLLTSYLLKTILYIFLNNLLMLFYFVFQSLSGFHFQNRMEQNNILVCSRGNKSLN